MSSSRSLFPVLMLGPTVALTAAASFDGAVFIALRRDPQALARGEVWRLLSPVLVQADALQGGWLATIVVWLMVGVTLAVAQRAFGAPRTLLLYALGALAGHGVGMLWAPLGAGCSVAGCGVLGAIAAWLLRARPLRVRIGAGVWLGLAVVATWFEDLHGPALLVGALAAPILLRSVPLPAELTEEAQPASGPP